MKDVLKGLLHSTELFALAVVGITVGSIPLGIALTAVAFVPASKLMDDIRGNDIKGSIFSVTRGGHIHQNSLARPLRMVSLLSGKDKQKKFTEEALNMYTELKEKDKSGKPIKYHTRSQPMTLSLLRRMQRYGYIENLDYKQVGESRLIAEKILFGNFKGLFKARKHPMYDITFNLTNKERKKNELMVLAGLKKPDPIVVPPEIKANLEHLDKIREEQTKKSAKEELIDLKAELLAAKELAPTEAVESKEAKK